LIERWGIRAAQLGMFPRLGAAVEDGDEADWAATRDIAPNDRETIENFMMDL